MRNKQRSPLGHHLAFCAVFCVCTQFSAVLSAAEIVKVLSFSAERCVTGPKTGHSWSFSVGEDFLAARTLLLNPNNFGDTGVVHKSIEFLPPVTRVTRDALLETDIFVIDHVRSELSINENYLLNNFLSRGGAILESRDFWPGRREIAVTTAKGFFGGSSSVVASGASTAAIMNGPFGVVSGVSTGATGVYQDIGSGVVIAEYAVSNGGGPCILMIAPETGSTALGRAVLMGDEEIFMTGGISGDHSGLLGSANNSTFLLNVFAFLSDAPGFASSVQGNSWTLYE